MSDWGAAVRHLLDLAADKFEATGAAPAAVAEVTALLRRGPDRRDPARAPPGDLGDKLAHADVVGPYGGLFAAEGFHLGAIILGPPVDYPAHAHPAVEIYYLLAGHGDWRRGHEAWTARPPGALFHHPPNMPHAARTADQPVLALVCLFGEVVAPPVLL